MLHDSPLPGGHTPRSDEGNKKHNELTELCIKLSSKVESLEEDLKLTKKERITKKRTKTKPKRQNRTRNGKDCERQIQIEAEKSTPKPKSQHIKKYKFKG
ncbi:hypothetical protein Tco_1255697 [Tanacetum coccineum]